MGVDDSPMPSSRACLRRVAPLVASVLLGGVAIAAGARSLYTRHLEAELDAEIEAVRASGLLERERAGEDPELVAARMQLEEILRRIIDADPEGFFGAPWMQRPDQAEQLAAGLAERAALLAELDDLPALLWDSPREPCRSPRQRGVPEGERLPSNSLGVLRAATNLLCGQAWHAAREPAGAAEAGYRLALAWALARVTDHGTGLELSLRASWEGIVVETLDQLLAEGIVDPRTLTAPLVAELARDDRGDRLHQAVECELVFLVDALERGADLWFSAEDVSRVDELRLALDCISAFRANLREDLTKRHRPPFRPGVLPTGPVWESSVDHFALARDLSDNRRARILCAE
jgi:hypothetical protein